jgi:outer membrane lipoprotein SlyB
LIIGLLIVGSASATVAPALAQRAGQSVSIQYGVVASMKPVELKSDAVPRGAVVGGALGLASASGKSSGKKARNSIVGAAAGSAIASSSRGNTSGMLYDVDLGGGQGRIQVVSDQSEIRVGDCVGVEKVNDTANIRRMSSAYCQPANASAIAAVAQESEREATECLAAKQQLVDANTSAEADLAALKITLLCND